MVQYNESGGRLTNFVTRCKLMPATFSTKKHNFDNLLVTTFFEAAHQLFSAKLLAICFRRIHRAFTSSKRSRSFYSKTRFRCIPSCYPKLMTPSAIEQTMNKTATEASFPWANSDFLSRTLVCTDNEVVFAGKESHSYSVYTQTVSPLFETDLSNCCTTFDFT